MLDELYQLYVDANKLDTGKDFYLFGLYAFEDGWAIEVKHSFLIDEKFITSHPVYYKIVKNSNEINLEEIKEKIGNRQKEFEILKKDKDAKIWKIWCVDCGAKYGEGHTAGCAWTL